MAFGLIATEGLIETEGQVAAEGQFAAKGQETLNNELKLGIGVIRHRNCLVVLYSLTKYSAIFAEVKGYFGITAISLDEGACASSELRVGINSTTN